MIRGSVWQVNLDPTIGSEIDKMRPAVIMSSNALGVLPLRVIVPLTGWQPAFSGYPWMVRILPSAENGLRKTSSADAFQVKSVSTRRLVRRLGAVSASDLDAIASAVARVIQYA